MDRPRFEDGGGFQDRSEILNLDEADDADAHDRFLEVIAASEQLDARLAEAPTAAHRSAIVDIHAYLGLLRELTDLKDDKLKQLLGCRKAAGELVMCDLGELQVSRGFLSFASELALAAEAPPERARSAVRLAIDTFKRAGRDEALARYAITQRIGDQTALQLVASNQMDVAQQQIDDQLQTQPIERFTASGRRILLNPHVVANISSAVIRRGTETQLPETDARRS